MTLESSQENMNLSMHSRFAHISYIDSMNSYKTDHITCIKRLNTTSPFGGNLIIANNRIYLSEKTIEMEKLSRPPRTHDLVTYLYGDKVNNNELWWDLSLLKNETNIFFSSKTQGILNSKILVDVVSEARAISHESLHDKIWTSTFTVEKKS